MHKDKMNNKEITELKKIYFDRIEREQFQAPDEVWEFFEPHLKSNDEIKREAEYRTTYAPILEKSAVHRFIEDLDDRAIYDKEELLGIWAESYLTQQSLDGGEDGSK